MNTFKIILLIPLCLPLIVSAQGKYDYNWIFGYGPSDSTLHYGGTQIDFNSGNPVLNYFDTDIGFISEKASISNSNGNLIAFTNGCQVQNMEYQLMMGGDNINEGPAHEQYCNSGTFSYLNFQGALFLPMPGSDSLYALFHLRWLSPASIVKDLLYSVVDASGSNGLGAVVAKNLPLRTDTFTDMLTACRHANGRDWWLVVEENHRFVTLPPDGKAKYHFYLFDPYGVHYIGEQQIGALSSYQSWVGQACFSPDGTRYAEGNIYNGVNFFDFDRCTGELSNPGYLDLKADSVVAMGLAFSPNSRYLYVTTGLWILQYDMEAADVGASVVHVAQYDGFESQLPTTFFQLALAPNGKVYGSSHFGTDVLHIIHQPDQPGLACEVEQHGLKLPTYHAFTMPNVPHYRLYDLPGSVCDSLGIDAPIVKTEVPEAMNLLGMKLQPNPANDLLTIYLAPETSGRIVLMDMTGKIMATQPKAPGNEQITLTTMELPSGVYFISFRADSGESFTQKVIVQH
jgi:hypothetical protein